MPAVDTPAANETPATTTNTAADAAMGEDAPEDVDLTPSDVPVPEENQSMMISRWEEPAHRPRAQTLVASETRMRMTTRMTLKTRKKKGNGTSRG